MRSNVYVKKEYFDRLYNVQNVCGSESEAVNMRCMSSTPLVMLILLCWRGAYPADKVHAAVSRLPESTASTSSTVERNQWEMKAFLQRG